MLVVESESHVLKKFSILEHEVNEGFSKSNMEIDGEGSCEIQT
jgi:hypothetical protein